MGETFAQELCSVAPCRAGGWVITGVRRIMPCTVRVADGELTIVRPSRTVLLQRPAGELEIVSRPMQWFGAAVILRVNGELLAVEFDFVYRRQKFQSSQQKGIVRAAQAVFLASAITYIPTLRLGRRLAAEFAAALRAAGALDKKPRPPGPPPAA